MVVSVISLCLIATMATADPSPAKSPNFIIILTDDQGDQDLGVFGSPDIKTPHIDRMAKEGREFTCFYSASSLCSASRAALLTGSYPKRVGVDPPRRPV